MIALTLTIRSALVLLLSVAHANPIEELATTLGCEQTVGGKTTEVCTTNLPRDLEQTSIEAHVGRTPAEFLNLSDSMAEALFRDLLKARTLEAQMAHMLFRDGMDLNAQGDIWDTAEKMASGDLGASMLSINAKCTQRFTEAEALRKHGSAQFFLANESARKRQADAFSALEDFIVLGAGNSNPGACRLNPYLCKPLGERALLAKAMDNALKGNKLGPDEKEQFSQALSLILMSDPALNEYIEAKPGACANGPEKSQGYCQKAYQLIGGYEQMARDPEKNADGSGPPVYRADFARHVAELKLAYQQANRKAKTTLLASVRETCANDGSDLVYLEPIVRSVLSDNPTLKPAFCKLYNKKKKDRDRRQYWESKFQTYGWAGMILATVGSVAAMVTGTGVAFAPVLMVLGTTSGGSFVGQDLMRERLATETIAWTTPGVGALAANPLEREQAIVDKQQAEKDFRRDMTTLAVATTFDGAMVAIGAMRALSPSRLETAIEGIGKLRAAGKITAQQEAILIARAQAKAAARAANEARELAQAELKQLENADDYSKATAAIKRMRRLDAGNGEFEKTRQVISQLRAAGKLTEKEAGKLTELATRLAQKSGPRLMWKKFWQEAAEEGPVRFFVRTEKRPPTTETRSFVGRMLTPSGHSPQAKVRPFLNPVQALPRAVTRVVRKEYLDFHPFRPIWEEMNHAILGPNRYFAGPVTAAIFWETADYSWYGLADRYLSKTERNALQQNLQKLIANDYRYADIKKALAKGKCSEAECLQRAANLRGAYNSYYEFMDELSKQGKQWDDLDVTEKLLYSRDVAPMMGPLFDNIRTFQSHDFWTRSKNYKFTGGPNLTDEQKSRLMSLTHQKLYAYRRIPGWFAKEAKGNPKDLQGKDRELYEIIATEPYIQDLVRLRDAGKLSQEKLEYYVMDDVRWRHLLLELETVGAQPLRSPRNGQVSQEELTIEHLRAENLKEIQEATEPKKR